MQYSFRLLAYRDRSEREMHQKLTRKGFSESIAVETVARLKARGFIDDRRLAESLLRDARERKCLGRRGAREFLLKRGIPGEMVDELPGVDDDHAEAARTIAARRLKTMRDNDEETVKRRLWGVLARRGFAGDTIRQVLKSLDIKEEP